MSPDPAEVPASVEFPRLHLRRIEWLAVLLGVVWVFAGIGKALDFAAFSEVVAVHGVLGKNLHVWLPAAPTIEILLGVVLFVSVGHPRRVRLLRAALLVGCLLLISMAIYLMLVPAAVLAEVGCGCFGQAYSRIASGMSMSARLPSIVTSGLLLVAHTMAFERLRPPGHDR